MSYLERLKAARAANVPISATFKTVERCKVPSNSPTSLTLETLKRDDVTPSEGFEGCQSEHIPGQIPAPTFCHHGADLPPGWALQIANLSNSPAPGDYHEAHWRDALAGMEAFCAQWAVRARALGWQAEELFSLHPVAPAARHDKRGLALSLGGGARVEAINSEGADIRRPGGSRLRFYRRAAHCS